MSIPEIRTVGRKTGRAELDEHAFGVNCSEFECPFVLKDRSKRELVAEIREKLAVLPGVNLEIGGPISHRIDAMLSGTQSNIAIKVFGTDLNKMYTIGRQIKSAIADVEGIADINVEQQVERPELNIVPKRELLARFGISLPEFAECIKVSLEGEPVSTVYEGNRSFDLTLNKLLFKYKQASHTYQQTEDRTDKIRHFIAILQSCRNKHIKRRTIA
jgi:Cu(I)/Ag(I) efflux system membrane protein CusA/SilA